MDRVLKGQLDRLNTDHIDYYLLHGLNGDTWNRIKKLGAGEFLDKAKSDGRINYAGFSFHGDIDAFKDIVDSYDWEFCQIQYNYLDENNQAGTEGLKYATAKGLGVIVMEPLRGGNLAGKVPPEVQAIWDEAEIKRSPAEWGLRWIWNHPEVTVVLSGMNREDHIEENLRIAGEAHPESLSEDELQLVRKVVKTYQRLMKAGCTGCRYCMPCPSGVDIPTCFEYYNSSHVFGDKLASKLMYLIRLGGAGGTSAASHASLCQNCGECEEKCPQHLSIPALLEDVVKEFEGRGFRLWCWLMKLTINDLPRWLAMRRARQVEKRGCNDLPNHR
jgi:predicted aldo/keto reductase-like oxidoreductase